MQVDALLCDAVTIREGLLHVLGGGVTRIWRKQYPARLGLSLALLLEVHPSEAAEQHRLRVAVMGPDGQQVAEVKGQFRARAGKDKEPGEQISIPMVMPLGGAEVPAPGAYSVNILIDGQLQRSLTVVAREHPAPQAARPTAEQGDAD